MSATHSVKLKMPAGPRFSIDRVPVDQIGICERASSFTKRSIKNEAKMQALYTIIRMTDLTTLEGADTQARVKSLCLKARIPAPAALFEAVRKSHHPDIPSTAAVCVYPAKVKTAKEALRGSSVAVASVATGFPAGQVELAVKLRDTKQAVRDGADEIDMVIDRGAFLQGQYQKVFDEIVAVKDACEDAHLKVILETGELGSFDKVRFASDLAIQAGADFIKTSTGKISPAATLPVTLVMLYAIADHYDRTGVRIGMKPAGGIRDAKLAIQYLVMVNEILGEQWLCPERFRFGASSLLNDVLKQIFKQITGRYYYDDAFSVD